MTDGPASEEQSPRPGGAGGTLPPRPVTFKSMAAKILRLFEIQSQIIGLRFALAIREVLLTTMLVAGAALLLLLGLVFLYVAVFKALLLVMGPIAVCLIFAAVHLLAALVIWLVIQSRRSGAGTAAPTPPINSGGQP